MLPLFEVTWAFGKVCCFLHPFQCTLPVGKWTNMNQYMFFWHFPKCNGVPSLPGLIPVSDNDRAWYDDSWKVMWMTAPVMSTPSTTSTTTRSTQGFEASWTKTSFDTSNTTPIKSAFSLMKQGSQQTSVPRQGIHAHWQNSLLSRKVLRNEQIAHVV